MWWKWRPERRKGTTVNQNDRIQGGEEEGRELISFFGVNDAW